MPEMNGIETLVHLRRRAPTIPVIFITGYATVSAAVRAMKLGLIEAFVKRSNISAYFDGRRGEREIVVRPRRVSRVQRLPL